VHTTDAAKTIGRLISMFPSEEQQVARIRLADNLKGVISQRLLSRVDGKGRAVAAEIMVATKTVQEYVREPEKTAGLRDVIERGRDEYGMQSFDQHLTELYRGGVIALDVAMAAASNPSDFERALNFSDAAEEEPEPIGDLADAKFATDEEKPEDESGEELLLSESVEGEDFLELER